MSKLTDDEQLLVIMLANCFTKHTELPVQHSADNGEFAFHIHKLQHIVMSRPTVRNHPELFILKKP